MILLSCDNDTPGPNTVPVNLQFNHLVDNSSVQLDQLIYKNALDQDFSIKTIKYFISDITFHKSDGSKIAFEDILYVDVRTPETVMQTLATNLPVGDYSGISFVHGLKPANNVTGSLGLELDKLMEWPVMMGGGYHYMKLEGEYKAGSTESFFNFHSGALDGVDYSISVELTNQPFTVTKELDLAFNMEIQNWFTNPVDWDFTYFGSGIMGNQEAQQTVQQNGSDVFSFAVVENL